MSNKRKKTSNGLNIALGILLVTWTILLALLIFIFVVRLQGYQDFNEWLHRNEQPVTGTPTEGPNNTPTPTDEPEPTLTLTPEPTPSATPMARPTVVLTPTLTPTATPTPTATATPTPTATATPTPAPTEPLTFLEALRVSGDEGIDADIRRQAGAFAGDETAVLAYEVHEVENYLSVVFHKTEEFEGESVEVLLPLVYDLTTKQQVTGSDLMKESYFAIIKERLQTYVADKFPASEGTDFITYMEIYQVEDYEKFYMTEDSLVFWFDGNTLLSEGQKPFGYTVSLEEAKAFFYYNLDGTRSGIAIRELDPEKPMLAITFDDGPYPRVEDKLIELFNQYNGKATFFYVADRIDKWFPTAAQTAYDAGFEVASHTYTHTVNYGTDDESMKEVIWQEFNKANEVIALATGHAPDYVRLPGGSVGKWANQLPLPIVNWNNDSEDWKKKSEEDGGNIVFEQMKNKKYRDGDIILFHSLYDTSYDALVELLAYLDERGYQFVTLSELFYYRGVELKNGVVHHNGWGDTKEN